MQPKDKDLYFVAVKIFLENKGRFLILEDKYGGWDLPGGRIRADEFNKPLSQVISRKIKEELGAKVKLKIGLPLVHMRHERREAVAGHPKVRIFAIGYQAKYLGGEIKISPRHLQYKWVAIKSFKPKSCFRGGWLKGVEEYLKLKRNR